jgi:hypothetical protein
MTMQYRLRKLAVVGALSVLAAGTASAHVLSAVTSAANFTFAAGTPQLLLSGFFGVGNGQRIVVTFSAECAVRTAANGNHNAWTDIDIRLLNAAGAVVTTLSPTAGSGDAFCSSDHTAAFDAWASNSVTAVSGQLPAGNYRVQVRGRLNNGATGGWYGQRALVVSR